MFPRISLIIAALSLTAGLGGCSAFSKLPDYMAKEDGRPHGYSEIALPEGGYQVSYETYKKYELVEVEELAIRRAAELSVEQGAKGFDVENTLCFKEYQFDNVPEQSASGRTVTLASAAGPVSVPVDEPNFPGYTRTFEVRKCLLKIKLLQDLEVPDEGGGAS
ncbi:hypothetical protein [Hahella sp. HN01]|uniref:CC0125/CC1285 family lipoprotein n=1 Tax=Hahella sp. HN01 TaxID=2847262 RepID=UPI001C1EB06B|nr:hypothetical protein [Hahella sp. HN01]MBU6954258.1 hypothetical protein [Hahella sp. HN01]